MKTFDILSLSGSLVMLYKKQDYVHFDQFDSCNVIVSVYNGFILLIFFTAFQFAFYNFSSWHMIGPFTAVDMKPSTK